MDAEAAFVEHAGNLVIQENLISFIVAEVLVKNAAELKILERDVVPLKILNRHFIESLTLRQFICLKKRGVILAKWMI